jgi:hypothetical protein
VTRGALAQELLDQVLESTSRLRLLETTRYALLLLLRVILGAHRGRRREMDAAFADLRRAEGVFQLTGRYGLHLLLRVQDGTADLAENQAITAAPVSRLRWDRQFAPPSPAGAGGSGLLAGRGRRGKGLADECHVGRDGRPGSDDLLVERPHLEKRG